MRRAILVIEDEPAMRLLIQEYLELLGYTVLPAPDGTTALELATQPISMAFVDLNLPDMNGVTLMRRLREAKMTAPLVVLSANLRESFAAEIAGMGVHEVLEKPVDLLELERVVREVAGDPVTGDLAA